MFFVVVVVVSLVGVERRKKAGGAEGKQLKTFLSETPVARLTLNLSLCVFSLPLKSLSLKSLSFSLSRMYGSPHRPPLAVEKLVGGGGGRSKKKSVENSEGVGKKKKLKNGTKDFLLPSASPSSPHASDDHHPLLRPLRAQHMLVRLERLAQRRAQPRVHRIDLLLRRRVALDDVDRVADDGEDLLLVRHREAAPVEWVCAWGGCVW